MSSTPPIDAGSHNHASSEGQSFVIRWGMPPAVPHLILDIDGVLQAPRLKYGYEQHRVIAERIPTELVHPSQHPQNPYQSKRRLKPTVPFNTHVRVSSRLLDDLEALGLHVVMLTTWLEHGSARSFLDQAAAHKRWFPDAEMLEFPGRAEDGSLSVDWKVNQLRTLLARDPRPFVWIDDDEVPLWSDAVKAEFAHLPHLLIAPVFETGLTHDHVDQLRAFIDSHPDDAE